MLNNDERTSLGLDGLNVSYVKMTPLARRIAEERGIDARTVQGSGYGGKIYSSDLQNVPAGHHRAVPERPPVEYLRPVPEKATMEQPRQVIEMKTVENSWFVPEMGPAENPRYSRETAPAENSRYARETAPVENNRFAREITPVENSRYAQEITPAENSRYARETAPMENNRFMRETAPAENSRFAPEENHRASHSGYPEASSERAYDGYHGTQPERAPAEYPSFSPERAPAAEKQPQRQVINLPREYLQPSREATMERVGTKNPSAMVNAAIAADEDVAGVFRMNEARRAIALQAAKSSAQAASVTQHMETDVTMLLDLQKYLNTESEVEDQIPLTAYYLKAMAMCVRECSRFRMRLTEAGDAYLLIDGAHVGLQMDDGDGIATPVIRNADFKSVDEIGAEVMFLMDKARQGGLSEYNSKGSTITLLDKGDSNVQVFTPVISQPSAAILGIGSIYERLVMTERSIENRQFVMLSLTFDYRIINGAEADEFQRRMKAILEDPKSIIG